MPTEAEKRFLDFYEAARHNDILDERVTVMVHMAAAMALGCYPCMRHYRAQTEAVGITRDELDAVQAIVMAVSAGKVDAQIRDALTGVDPTPGKACGG